MGKSCAVDLRVAGSSPPGQLLIFFHNVFSVLTKTLYRHSSLVPRSLIKDFVRSPRCCIPRLRPPALSIPARHPLMSIGIVSLSFDLIPAFLKHITNIERFTV